MCWIVKMMKLTTPIHLLETRGYKNAWNSKKREVNMVTGLSNDLSYSEKLKLLGLQSLEGRRLKLDMLHTYKPLNNPNSWFTRVHDVSRRTTRLSQDSTNLIINQSRTVVRRFFYSIRAARGWNALPTDTRNSSILQGQLYNVKE